MYAPMEYIYRRGEGHCEDKFTETFRAAAFVRRAKQVGNHIGQTGLLNWVDFHFSRRAFLGTRSSHGFNGISCSGKFVVSKADEEYDARDTGPKRKFRFGPVCF